MEYKDYYQTLGVSRNADEKEIKRAFRKLAQQYHPDKNPDDAAAERRFKEINEAYTVLSDSDKRSKYDKFGAQWEQYERAGGQAQDFDWSGWAGGGGGGRTRTVTPEEFEQMFGGMGGAGGGGFSSFFDTLFGGGMGGAGAGRQFRQAPNDPRYGFQYDPRTAAPPQASQVDVKVTLEEAYNGSSRMLEAADGKRFEVNIPRGVRTGSKVRMKGAAGQGDIVLKVEVLPHQRFTRDGDNLRVQVPTDFVTAALGGEIQVPTLERPVVLTVPAGTQGGKVFRLRGLGMPSLKQPDQRGDLLAEIQIRVPTELGDEERELFEKLQALQ